MEKVRLSAGRINLRSSSAMLRGDRTAGDRTAGASKADAVELMGRDEAQLPGGDPVESLHALVAIEMPPGATQHAIRAVSIRILVSSTAYSCFRYQNRRRLRRMGAGPSPTGQGEPGRPNQSRAVEPSQAVEPSRWRLEPSLAVEPSRADRVWPGPAQPAVTPRIRLWAAHSVRQFSPIYRFRPNLGADGVADGGEAVVVEGVPDPFAASVAVYEAGVAQNFRGGGKWCPGFCRWVR